MYLRKFNELLELEIHLHIIEIRVEKNSIFHTEFIFKQIRRFKERTLIVFYKDFLNFVKK